MKNIGIKTWTSGRTNPLWKENLKKVALHPDTDFYIEAKIVLGTPIIEINHDGNSLFSGSVKELIKKLS